MATRFYFPSSGTSAISPAVDAAWDGTGTFGFAHRDCVTTKTSTANNVGVSNNDSDNADHDVCVIQFISPAIAAQTISAQTIKSQFLCNEISANSNVFFAICIRVLSNDGTTVRGTVLSLTRDGTEMLNTGYQNRRFSATSSSVSASDNDRIVIEIGGGGDPLTGGLDFAILLGDSAGTDLAEDDTTTTQNDPWVEFANTITFAGGGGGGGSASPAWISSKGGQW